MNKKNNPDELNITVSTDKPEKVTKKRGPRKAKAELKVEKKPAKKPAGKKHDLPKLTDEDTVALAKEFLKSRQLEARTDLDKVLNENDFDGAHSILDFLDDIDFAISVLDGALHMNDEHDADVRPCCCC